MRLLNRIALCLFVLGLTKITPARAVTLGDALDYTNFVWTTCTSNALERPWLVETNANPLDGVDDAVSGNKNAHGTVSWLQTTVIGPGTLSYWCRVSSEDPLVILEETNYFDYLTFELNGSEMDRIAGSCGGWVHRYFFIPEGTNTLRWSYIKDSVTTDSCGVDQARIDMVEFQQGPLPLAEALGTCGWSWSSDGTSGLTTWIGQTNVFSTDGKAAESGFADVNEETWLRVAVAGVSNVSFLWRVSSRTNADYLEFYTNSYVHNPSNPPANYATRISGSVGSWRSNFFRLNPALTNTLTWRYVKGTLAPVGQNRGWLDEVKFTYDAKRIPFKFTAAQRLPNGGFQLSMVGNSNCTCRVEVSTNLANWSVLQDVFTATTNTGVLDAVTTNSPQRYYRGKTL